MKTEFEKLSDSHLNRAVDGLKAIAHPCRLKILCSLVGNELTVGEMVKLMNLSQSSVSQHLSRMKAAGVLEDRRAGNQVYYRLREESFDQLLDALCNIYVRE